MAFTNHVAAFTRKNLQSQEREPAQCDHDAGVETQHKQLVLPVSVSRPHDAKLVGWYSARSLRSATVDALWEKNKGSTLDESAVSKRKLGKPSRPVSVQLRYFLCTLSLSPCFLAIVRELNQHGLNVFVKRSKMQVRSQIRPASIVRHGSKQTSTARGWHSRAIHGA